MTHPYRSPDHRPPSRAPRASLLRRLSALLRGVLRRDRRRRARLGPCAVTPHRFGEWLRAMPPFECCLRRECSACGRVQTECQVSLGVEPSSDRASAASRRWFHDQGQRVLLTPKHSGRSRG